MRSFCLICLLLGSSFWLQAQSDKTIKYSGEKQIRLKQLPDSLLLDSLTLAPNSIRITSQELELDSSQYHYDYSSGYLHFRPQQAGGPFLIKYRLLPFSLSATLTHKTLDLYDSTAFFRDKPSSKRFSPGAGEELFATPSLQKSGSISRGISIGNRRDVFINSSLNLQMAGSLSEDLNIRASITDQNIPLQPDGNSQQLQDFDNVLVELYNQHFSLTAGDVVLQQSGNTWQGNSRLGNNLKAVGSGPYFLQYRRNVQGGLLRMQKEYSESLRSDTEAGFALARGKFASVALQVQEGIQGPYQLRAGDNPTLGGSNSRLLGAYFIIANSEKVYLDGELLERGLDRDYTIDYNLGEITFNSNILLTRYSRVYVDFEYADRNYSRSIFTASHQHHFKHVTVYANFYREADNPNQSLGFNLSDDEKWMLSEAGDERHQVWIPAVDSAVHLEQQSVVQTNRQSDVPGVGNLYRVFYDRIDTVVNGQTIEIYQFAGQQGDFRVDFNFVGEGKGDYVVSGTTVNSKVFRWLAPMDGKSRGNYAPLRPLATPKSQQMLVLGTNIKLSTKDAINIEVAISKNDLNSLSEKDAFDDQGQAVLIRYSGAGRKISNSPWFWSSTTAYEYRQRYFTEVDPYRSVEFERDWSIQPYHLPDSSRTDDHLLSSSIQLKKDVGNKFHYQWIGRAKGEHWQGQQHRVQMDKSLGLLQLSGQTFLMRSQQPQQISYWNRLTADAHLRGLIIRPGYTYRIDKNQLLPLSGDSIIFTAMNFEEHQLYLQNGDSVQGVFRLDYSLRRDFLPYQGELMQSDLARTLRATADLPIFHNQQISLQLAYRELEFRNDSIFTKRETFAEGFQSNTILGQLNWSGRMADGAIHSEFNYSLANGREPRREFVYVRVPVGEGVYTWRDDNANGIEDLDEFYEARYFDERNYIRVFVPSNDFLLAYTNTLNYQLNLQPPAAWLEKTGIRSLLGRLSSLTSWNVQKKITDESLAQRLLPVIETAEEKLLSTRENLRSSLFFNRRNTTFSAELGVRKLRRKQLLNAGFEERQQSAYLLNLRWNLNRHWGMRWQGEQGNEVQLLDMGSQSGQNGRRNFQIQYMKLAPELSWQPNMNSRIAGSYSLVDRQNQQYAETGDGGETSLQQVIGLDLRLNKLMKHSLNANVEYVNLDYSGDESSPIAYEMLEGLRKGSNLRWTLNWQQHLLDGLQLSVNYFGRKSENSSTVHSGSVMIRALF